MFGDILDVSKISPFALLPNEVIDGESNTSIVAKIAWKYRVKPAALAKYILQNDRKITVSLGIDMAVSANSVTNKSVIVDQRIKFITGLSNLKGSYIYLRDFLDKGAHGLISVNKKWCNQCYGESIEGRNSKSGARTSDQLCWSLNLAKHCAKHLCSLSEKCGKCYRHQPYISSVVEPGFCNYCYACLAQAPSIIAEDDFQESKILESIFKYDIFYPQVTAPSNYWTMARLAKNLRAVIELCGDRGEQVAFRCGVSEHTIKDWCACRHGVSFESLISIIDGFGLSKASDLFLDSDSFTALVSDQFSGSFAFRAKNRRSSLLPDISAYFKDILAGKERALSRSVIAEKFGVSKGMLENAFKAEVEKVSILYEKQKVSESLKVKDRLQFEMNNAVRRCGAKERLFDWAHILAELKDIDLSLVSPRDLDKAKSKAIKLYLGSKRRDQDRDVNKLLCD
jgi:hypothetical protein